MLITIIDHINSMEQSFWEFDSCFHDLCGIWRIIHNTHHRRLSCASWIQSTSSYPIHLRFTLIFSSHLCLGLLSSLFSSQSNEDIWRSGGTASLHILNLSTRWRWVVSFTSWPLYPWGKNLSIHWTEQLMGPIVSLDVVAKRKILSWREMNLSSNLYPSQYQVIYSQYDWAIPALHGIKCMTLIFLCPTCFAKLHKIFYVDGRGTYTKQNTF
jgi:hypothetical protein